MSRIIRSALQIKDQLFERLRYARLRLGLKQSELAEAGGISRATQLSYESGGTAPNTDYLRLVQSSGLDIPFVLFGDTASPQDAVTNSEIDWQLLQESVDAVDLFCIKAAPNCPSSYKWQMIQQVYASLKRAHASEVSETNLATMEVVRHAWEKV